MVIAAGRGVKICDLDTGIDVFHPMFWYPGDDSYEWIDANGDNVLSPGLDAVDLNGNGTADLGEGLDYVEATVDDAIGVGGVTNPPGYTVDLDWLYNDTNANGVRDYGAPVYDDDTPSFGELLFIADDADGNGTVDVGDFLALLAAWGDCP